MPNEIDADAARHERVDIARAVAGRTIASLFQEQSAAHADVPALQSKRGGAWQSITYREYAERVQAAALGLMDLGLQTGQAVAILSGTREEYNIADLGVTHAGGITVTLYQSLAPSQIAYVVDHSEAVLAFVENAAQAEKFLAIRESIPRVRRLIVFEGAEALPRDGFILTLEHLLARGAELARTEGNAFSARWRAITPESVATLIYTSGTTGPPKGAILTHGQVCYAQEAGARLFGHAPGDRLVGYLPMAHVAERGLSLWGAIRTARTIYFCPDVTLLGQTLVEVRPHAFFGVPRIWEKMHAALLAGIDAEPDSARRAGVRQAIAAAEKVVVLEQVGQPVPAPLAEARAKADAMVFSHFRERLGLDQARITASGAAPIASEILTFFHAIGLPILEVYGQTEAVGLATINRREHVRIGTVGLRYPGMEVRLAEDGEILVRGGNVFSGYFKEPALTRETLDKDGWLHSGDIGTMDADGFLRVVDRKKDIIITAGGKNVTPSNIENALKHQPLISQAMVVGDRRPYLVALLTLDEEATRPWARARAIPADDWSALVRHPDVHAELQRYVDLVNQDVSRVEQIKRFAVLPRDWAPDTDELTPTLKVRRKVVSEKYATAIDALYG
jgi:long-chain acyl-CoA synthetase